MRSRALLVSSALLFAGWIAYLAFLVVTGRPTVVVSRPQLLTADLVVVADVEGIDRPVTVREVLRAPAERTPKPGDALTIVNFKEARGLGGKPGLFILPLTVLPEGYRLTPVPRSPGYGGGPPRVYPATPETVAHVRGVLP